MIFCFFLVPKLLVATLSPILLDIAKPGIFSFFSQTLIGPNGLPSWSRKLSILPPHRMILSASKWREGLWSRVKGLASHYFFSLSLPITARESPTLAEYILSSKIRIDTKVVPNQSVYKLL